MTATIRKNGVEVGSGPVYVPPVATRVNNYLGRSYWSGDGYFQGELAEIILYNRALSVAEQGAVHAHLAEKYELAVIPPAVLEPPDAPSAVDCSRCAAATTATPSAPCRSAIR